MFTFNSKNKSSIRLIWHESQNRNPKTANKLKWILKKKKKEYSNFFSNEYSQLKMSSQKYFREDFNLRKRAANTSAFKRIEFPSFWILILLLRSRKKDQRNSKQFSDVRSSKSLADMHLWVNCFCSLFGWFEPKAATLSQIIIFALLSRLLLAAHLN